MKNLVTGGGGFLGSHLVERLESEGHEVFSARRADYDLTRREDAERLFRDAAPEVVFHLAWSPDGSQLAVIRSMGGVTGEIWIVPGEDFDPAALGM